MHGMDGGEIVAYRFKCSACNEWHDGLPDMGYDQPDYAANVPKGERSTRVMLTSDLCSVDKEFFFIRCVLPLPIRGTDENFGWGVWSTLSEKNFTRYREHYDEDMSHWDPMFGYLSNNLPEYPETLSLKLNVQSQKKGSRPKVTLQPTDHPLAVEQRDGIAFEKVLKIVDPFLHQR